MKDILYKLFRHETLTQKEARSAITEISSGKINPAQIASFMTVFLMRPVNVDELTGFRDALMELCVKVNFDSDTIDVCGTGGDGKNTFNISTLTAFVIAGAGMKVAKHGNYGVSSVSGSSNVLEYFGYKFTSDEETLKRQLNEYNVCFMHAPLFHPALKNVAPVRKDLGIKSFFNMLGPLVNPANPHARLVGVYNKELGRIYNYILQNDRKQYAIVTTEGGFDEISLTGNFSVFAHAGERKFSPSDIDRVQLNEKDLHGGYSIADAALIFRNLLEGSGTRAQQDVVITNAAFGIQCATGKSLAECFSLAEESLHSKKALNIFKKIISE